MHWKLLKRGYDAGDIPRMVNTKTSLNPFLSIDYYALVTPAGFEPTTNRTGICHSIQLNYGAVLQR